MDPVNNAPFCPPSDAPGDVVPMLVVAALFLIGWLVRRHFVSRK